jgi:parallel beta-helix repeat protein
MQHPAIHIASRSASRATRTGGRVVAVSAALALLAALPVASQAGDAVCGSVVGPGETLTVTSSIVCNDADLDAAITVDSGTLDMGEWNIVCTGLNRPVGIRVIGNKARITGNMAEIYGCSHGVVIEAGSKHVVTGIEAEGNLGSGFWIQEEASKNTIRGNIALNNVDRGYNIDGDKNTVRENLVLGNDDGIEVDGAKNRILGNLAYSNADDSYDIDGDKNKVIGNLAVDSEDGFAVGGSGNKLVGNLAANNYGRGWDIDGHGNKVVKNGATENGAEGFVIDSAIKFVKNEAYDNALGGIVVAADSGVPVQLLKNISEGNGTTSGFDLEDATAGCGARVWKKNTFVTSSDPCIQ